MKGGTGKSLVHIHKTRQWDSEKDGKGGSVWKKKISILEETEYIYIHRDTHREREREEGRVGEREVTLNNRV